MRKILWCSLFALAAAGGCKKSEDRAMDNASKAVERANDNVKEQQQDVAKQQKDVAEERADVSKEQQDVSKQQRELTGAENELARARMTYVDTAKQRLAAIDGKLAELDAKTDATARDKASALRIRRDQLSNRIDSAKGTAADTWDNFRKDLDDQFSKLESDVNDALK